MTPVATDTERLARRHIPLAIALMLLFVAYYLWREWTIAGAFGFPLDDSWIHAQFARNLALGHGFSYNPGVPVSGSTAPLWTLLTASGYLITGASVLTAKLLGVVFLGLSVGFAYVLVRYITDDPREALFAAVVTGTLPPLVWASLSGMEVTLAVMLTLAGVLAHIMYNRPGDRRQYLAAVLFGLATLTRPECAVFFVASLIDRFLASTLIQWREVATRDWLLPAALHILLFLAIVMPFAVFSKTFGIGFLPNTAYAKALLWGRGLIAAVARGDGTELVRSFSVRPYDYMLSFLRESLNNNPVLFMLSSIGFLRLVFSEPFAPHGRCRSFIIPLSVLLFPLAVGVLVPFGNAGYQEGRYAAPLAPLMLVVGTFGVYGAGRYGARLLGRAKFMGRPATVVIERSLVWLFMLLALTAQLRGGWYRGSVYGREVDNIEDMQVTLGQWIDRNLPRDALVAVNDVGAIAYYTDVELLDTVGLISPDVLKWHRRYRDSNRAVFAFLEEQRPDFAVLFPSWYPEMVKRQTIFEPIHRVVLSDNVISGGDEMIVYRLHWESLENSARPDERGDGTRGRPDGDGPPGKTNEGGTRGDVEGDGGHPEMRPTGEDGPSSGDMGVS
ncbi:MAG: hypothetical protein GF405_09000 [Candidatus Eisenbacteria bacterium]|nr:hypothetical protein [Candidatus Eisenbacteria bacterium]